MVIPFNKRHNYTFLFLGISFALASLSFALASTWTGVGVVLLTGVVPLIFYFRAKKGYIKIEDGILSVNQLFR